jgi:hypothetical protein
MGQPKPGAWQGNQGVLSDLVVGFRLRFSDWFKPFDDADLGMALSVLGALPTGTPPDADEPVAVGTTLWDLQTQGDLAMHLGIDKKFSRRLDGRLVLGLNLHYEIFFPRTLKAPTGRKHPLLMNVAPYVGTDYVLDPGDYYGFSVSADVVAIKGPARGTWLVKGDVQRALALPPLLTLSLGYTFNGNLQSRFHSQSDLWDYDQEEKWQAGYRHVFRGTALFSFLRVGVPLQWYAGYRTMQLIPGQNARAGHVIVSGLRVPFKF